jgi:hypothetical protein
MLASKYFFFLTPIPVVFYLWVRRAGSAWSVPPRRWARLIGLALVIWAAVDWSPFLPSTWAYATSYTTGGQTVHGSLFFMGRIYHNLVEYTVLGTPPWFYLVFAAVKFTPATLLFAIAGLAVAVLRRRPAHRLVLSWMGVWFLVHSIFGSKWGRFFVSVLPAFLLLAGYAAALCVARVRRAFPRGRGHRPGLRADEPPSAPGPVPALAGGVIALVLAGGEAEAAVEHAPHERLYVSPLGGGDRNVTWFFPHCDYFDAGFREAIAAVARGAEPGAEVTSEIDWPAKLYAGWDGRPDLQITLLRPASACRQGKVCYVLIQTGRLYFHNQVAVASLAQRTPWYVERIRGEDVVKVYRLEPGESPFPGGG